MKAITKSGVINIKNAIDGVILELVFDPKLDGYNKVYSQTTYRKLSERLNKLYSPTRCNQQGETGLTWKGAIQLPVPNGLFLFDACKDSGVNLEVITAFSPSFFEKHEYTQFNIDLSNCVVVTRKDGLRNEYVYLVHKTLDGIISFSPIGQNEHEAKFQYYLDYYTIKKEVNQL